MNFRASFCDPFKPNIVELGTIDKNKIMETFDKIPWTDYLKKMKAASEKNIYYSPSLEIENKTNKNGVVVSAVDGKEWYIFYKRPKLVKKFFGLFETMNNDYTTEIHGQSEKEARECLTALVNNDLNFIDEKIRFI